MTQRIEKVQKLAKEVLGEAIQQLKDPRVGFATVTTVKVSADLRYARAYVSVLGSEEERDKTMAGLRSATRFLRTEMGHQMRLRYTPELTFELDRSPEEAQRLESILRELHEAEGEG